MTGKESAWGAVSLFAFKKLADINTCNAKEPLMSASAPETNIDVNNGNQKYRISPPFWEASPGVSSPIDLEDEPLYPLADA
jgi:hypothetical protein